METWMQIWKIVFFVSVGAFTLLSLWVVVFGAVDIKHMLADLKESAQESESPSPHRSHRHPPSPLFRSRSLTIVPRANANQFV